MTEEPESFEVAEEQDPRVEDVDPGGGIAWGVISLLIGVVLIVVFAVQNTETVPVEFLWWSGEFPLSIVIVATAAIALVLGELLGVIYRRRHRARMAEKEELRQLRDGS